MAMRVAQGEKDLLRLIRSRVSAHNAEVSVGIGDDCAVLAPRSGEEIVITTDFSIEGRHFQRHWHEPEAVGYKCLARSLSDVAAMGGRPVAVFVSLAVPKSFTVAGRKGDSWVNRFYTGLLALADQEQVTLAGGDLSESPTLAFADVVVIGAVNKGRALLRSGARDGDLLYVTGTLGGANAELDLLEKNPRRFRSLIEPDEEHPHFFPQPQLGVGRALSRRKLATACIDISDGLSTDLLHLCEESKLSAELDAAAIPVHAGARLEQALHGGDDYQLLFTAGSSVSMPGKIAGVQISRIGRMVARGRGTRVNLMQKAGGKSNGKALHAGGWKHF